MEIIERNSFVTIFYNRIKGIIIMEFMGINNPNLGKETLYKVIEFSDRNSIKGVIYDISRLKETFSNINDFEVNVYFPRLLRNGLRAYAIVLPDEVFEKSNSNQIIQKLGDKAQLVLFSNMFEAKRWVELSLKYLN